MFDSPPALADEFGCASRKRAARFELGRHHLRLSHSLGLTKRQSYLISSIKIRERRFGPMCRTNPRRPTAPDDADHPTIHGLRGTGILARAEQGYEVDQIANDIGMSCQSVEHYMRFRDQMKVGAGGQKTTSARQQGGLDRERQPGYISAANRRVCKTSGLGLQNFRKK